jgi:hypothetical protein
VQNTEKMTTSYFEGIFYFDKLVKIDKYFENFENNFSLYSYFNYIFKNNKVSFNYEDNELNLRMKFVVNQKLKEITFPLEKKNTNKEQSIYLNQVLIKLVSNLQDKIKTKNEEIIYLKQNNDCRINLDSQIINNKKDLQFIINQMTESVKSETSSKKSIKIEIEFKLLFNIKIYDENIINQLIDYAIQFNNQCLAIVDFGNEKICIVFTHKKRGNYCLLLNDSKKYTILEFYIDIEKFYFKFENKDSDDEIINIYNIKEFNQMEFFNCLIAK